MALQFPLALLTRRDEAKVTVSEKGDPCQLALFAIYAVGACFSLTFSIMGACGFVAMPLSTILCLGGHGVTLLVSSIISMKTMGYERTIESQGKKEKHSVKVDRNMSIVAAICAIASICMVFLVYSPFTSCCKWIAMSEKSLYAWKINAVGSAILSMICTISIPFTSKSIRVERSNGST